LQKNKGETLITQKNDNQYLYIFLDEGGNFDFSPNGTPYFTITAISTLRPFNFYNSLISKRYDWIEHGLDIEYFHASEDSQIVRNTVFEIVIKYLSDITIDTIIVEKRKTNPGIREISKFYPKILGHLIRYVCSERNCRDYKGVIITTDKIPVNKKAKAVEKSIKITVSPMMSVAGKPYQILHHESKSSMGLQVTDYCNWAIYRKWSADDKRSYELLKGRIRSEFDIFQMGTTYYY
jgi:hypothetical protein